MIGTPDFLAPEQARDPTARGHPRRHLRPRRHALLPPHRAGALRRREPDREAAQALHRSAAVAPGGARTLPPHVEQIIHWCMAKQPELGRRRRCNWRRRCSRSARAAAGGAPRTPRGPRIPASRRCRYPAPVPPTGAARAAQCSCSSSRRRSTTADPIRRRAERRFPWGVAPVALGGLVVASHSRLRPLPRRSCPRSEPPLDSFTNSRASGRCAW